MNTVFQKKAQEIAASVTLSDDERSAMRTYVAEYASYKPIRHPESSLGLQTWFRVSEVRAYMTGWAMHHVSAMVILGLVMSSAGVTYAAESALPGELLYPLKVSVTEELQGVLIVKNEGRVDWEKERAERRLQELGELMRRGELDTKSESVAVSYLEEHTERATKALVEISHTDPLRAAERGEALEATLGAHEEILARMAVSADEESGKENIADEDKEPIKNVVKSVRGSAKRVATVRQEMDRRVQAHTESEVQRATQEATSTESEPAEVPREDNLAITDQDVERVRGEAADLIAALAEEGDSYADSRASFEELYTLAMRNIERGSTTEAYRQFREISRQSKRLQTIIAAGGEAVPQILNTSRSMASTSPSGEVDPVADSLEPVRASSASTSSFAELYEAVRADIAQIPLPDENASTSVYAPNGVRDVVTEAKTLLFRADIAYSMEEEREALELLDRSTALLDRVREIGGHREEQQSTTPEETLVDGSVVGDVPGPVSLPPKPLRLDVVTVDVVQTDETALFSGAYYTPTACFTLTSTGTVQVLEERQTLTINLLLTETSDTCPPLLTAHPFTVSAMGSTTPDLIQVLVNDQPVRFEVVTIEASKQGESAELEVVSSRVATGTDPTASLFRSVLEKTQHLLQAR